VRLRREISVVVSMTRQAKVPEKPATPAVDSMTLKLLRMIYVGQVYSAETFALVLATYPGLTAEHRRKFEACHRLEAAMAQRLLDHLTRDLGQNVRPPVRARQAAETLAPGHGTWFDYMTELEGGAIRGVQSARALKTMHEANAPNLCATLLASRMALRDFARDELDEETEFSLDRILALLSPEDRLAVSQA
jgi:hypothetical protein